MKRHGNLAIFPTSSSGVRLVWAIIIGIITVTEHPLFAVDSTNAYAKWIKPWTEPPTNSPALGGAGLKLIITCVRNEADETAIAKMTPVERLHLAYHIKVSAAEVATNGCFRSYTTSNTDARTSAVRQLSAEDFQLLDPMFEQLPEDHSQLPPAGQRIVVQFFTGGQWHVRVYDGTRLPPEVKDLLDLLAKPYDKLF